MEYIIALLVGILVFIVIELISDLILGDRGKEGQIKTHFVNIRGNKREKIEENSDETEESNVKKLKNYKNIAIGFSILVLLLSLVLFKSIFISIFLSCAGILLPNVLKNRDAQKRMDAISIQYRDALNCIMSSLKSGLSMNSSIIKVPEELEKIHAIYKDKIILSEFKKMRHDLNMGIPLEYVLISFKERIAIEEVNDFVSSIIIIKKKGGNLVEVMENTITMITDKMTLNAEIKVLTAAKRMEAVLLSILPIFLVSVLSLFASEYMKPLFTTLPGQILAFIGFLMLLLNYFIGRKITDIEA